MVEHLPSKKYVEDSNPTSAALFHFIFKTNVEFNCIDCVGLTLSMHIHKQY